MNFLTNADSKAYQRLSLMFDLVILNACFLLSLIPVVTIGPALIALHRGVIVLQQKQNDMLVKVYFHAFRQSVGRGLLLEAYFALFTYLIVVSFRLTTILQPVMATVVMGALIGLAIVVWGQILYAFFYSAAYIDTFIHTLRISFQLAVMSKITSLILSVLIVGPFVLWGMSATLFALVSLIFATVAFALDTYVGDSLIQKAIIKLKG